MSANINTAEMGNLGLSVTEEEDIVAFLKTLNDRTDPGKGRSEKKIIDPKKNNREKIT
ncbi:MAG: hypothetical protein OIN87_03380 [Candidatus Methanoperedens sp.]|nr:hypothetical protein [Candidatus Methanoperedens sp.]